MNLKIIKNNLKVYFNLIKVEFNLIDLDDFQYQLMYILMLFPNMVIQKLDNKLDFFTKVTA